MLSALVLVLGLCSGAAAFAPSGLPAASASRAAHITARMSAAGEGAVVSRRSALAGAAAACVGVAAPALPAMASITPDGYKLKKDYPSDARMMLNNMVTATDLARGAPDMENIVKATRSEMNDFVAFYRRQPKVAGMPSFSTLYTAINTLSGHYASYGNKYPVPEKRKVRLQQQYKEIGACRHT